MSAPDPKSAGEPTTGALRTFTDPSAGFASVLLARLLLPALNEVLEPDSGLDAWLVEVTGRLRLAARHVLEADGPVPGFALESAVRAVVSAMLDLCEEPSLGEESRFAASRGSQRRDSGFPPGWGSSTFERMAPVMDAALDAAYKISLLELYEQEIGHRPVTRFANVASALTRLASVLSTRGLLNPHDPLGHLLARRDPEVASFQWLYVAVGSAQRLAL